MIRFVDLTEAYWTDPSEGTPVCAFLSTTTDRFLENGDGFHIFDSLKEVEEHPDADRLIGLLPLGFFERTNGLTKYRFHWRDGKIDEEWGDNPANAFTRLGYGAGAVAALDYHEVIS